MTHLHAPAGEVKSQKSKVKNIKFPSQKNETSISFFRRLKALLYKDYQMCKLRGKANFLDFLCAFRARTFFGLIASGI